MNSFINKMTQRAVKSNEYFAKNIKEGSFQEARFNAICFEIQDSFAKFAVELKNEIDDINKRIDALEKNK